MRMAEQLHERRERHLRRSRPYRITIVAAGFLVVIAGLGLSAPGVPGPGFIVIALGLALLALEFAWAERLLQRALRYLDAASDRAANQSTRSKLLAGATVTAAAAAAIVAIIALDVSIPPFD